LHLYPAGVISGQVLDEDQDPVPGLQLFALRIYFRKVDTELFVPPLRQSPTISAITASPIFLPVLTS
jgi:hypothetical protein